MVILRVLSDGNWVNIEISQPSFSFSGSEASFRPPSAVSDVAFCVIGAACEHAVVIANLTLQKFN